MKSLNNILRNALPAFATATIIAFSLSSCSQEEANNYETEAPVVKTTMKEEASIMPSEDLNSIGLEMEGVIEENVDTKVAAESEISIVKAVACTGIENHEPVDPDTYFDMYEGKVWVYSKVKMPKGEKGKIQHVYYLGDKEIQTIELDVKGPTFRTRSYKTMTENLCGEWKVEILTEGGKLLDTVEFSVYEEGGC